MLRTLLTLPLLLAIAPTVRAQDDAPIPSEVKKLMRSMVGEWTFKGSEGDRPFAGEERIRVIHQGTALLQRGFFDLGDGKKEDYTILSGWDGEKKLMVVCGVTSEGVTWTGEWKQVRDGTWVGSASGTPATFKVNADSMRYEESGDGESWVSEFTRKKKQQ